MQISNGESHVPSQAFDLVSLLLSSSSSSSFLLNNNFFDRFIIVEYRFSDNFLENFLGNLKIFLKGAKYIYK